MLVKRSFQIIFISKLYVSVDKRMSLLLVHLSNRHTLGKIEVKK